MFNALLANLGDIGVSWLTGVFIAITVFCVLFAFLGLKDQGKAGTDRLNLTPRTVENASKSTAERRKEIQDQIKKQEEQRRQKSASMQMRLERSGLKMSPLKLYVIFGILAVLVCGGLIARGFEPLYVLPLIPVIMYMLPSKFVNFKIKGMQKKFVAHFPDAIDVLVRGVRTGLPVNEGMRLVAREMPEPVSTEFKLVTDATSFGVTLDDALDRMYARMPLAEVNFFNIVLGIQKQTGGNLSEALGNLSNTLRDRKKLKLKIKALSSEAKASAMIIGSLPFCLSLLIYLVTPDYIALLFTTTTGNYLIAAGLAWMGIGIFVMKVMTDIEI